MGFLSSVTGVGRALHARVGYGDSSRSIRLDESQSDIFGNNGAALRHNRELAQEFVVRQKTTLADLVKLLAPDDADLIAADLLEHFGSVGEVFAAPETLVASKSRNRAIACLIRSARDLVMEGLCENVQRNAFDPSAPEVLNYLVGAMKGEQEEHLHAIFLDHGARYISDERMFSGSWSAVDVRLRPIMRRSIELNAAKVVLYHNHPSGSARPSEADCRFTSQAASVARVLGIELFDHLIVAGPAVFSMRTAGMLA